jgi:hypothetical protein
MDYEMTPEEAAADELKAALGAVRWPIDDDEYVAALDAQASSPTATHLKPVGDE